MQERVTAAGGTLTIAAADRKGVRLTARIPIEAHRDPFDSAGTAASLRAGGRASSSPTITRWCAPASAASSNRSPSIDVVAEAADGKAALDAVERHGADVLVLDLNMNGLEGIDVLRRCKAAHAGSQGHHPDDARRP